MNEGKKRKVIVAVDGSDRSLEAVRYTARLLPAGTTELVIFHVMNRKPEGAWFWDVEKASEHRPDLEVLEEAASRHEKRIREFMEEAAQLFKAQGVRMLIRDIKNGVARDIIEEAGGDCDAVVVGRQGLSSLELKGHLIGSTTNRLVAHMGKIPLWIVGGTPGTKKILIAMDESLLSMKALDYVSDMIKGTDAQIYLVHVMRELHLFPREHEKFCTLEEKKDLISKTEEDVKGAERRVCDVFEEASHRLKRAGIEPERVDNKIVTRMASRAAAIVEEARESGCDTIVIGRRGLSDLEDLFLGSMSNKILQIAEDLAVWLVP
ncbi:MAG: universal stress protein [Deltaproteobacteria bacterium]|nr:universal stress protein [Deltaproteobacteria bacterium]